ncbi:MAG: DUF423 domain-containing protein [Hyphomicrobiaceae bacterium]|nr:DUF423 domain-containing protein [Hyphomicrobiaceae bacterium]
MSTFSSRLIVLVAGLLGAAGVALAAAAAHRVNDPSLATASQFLVMHAAAALAVVALASRCTRPLAWSMAAVLMLAGAALFAGDIALRAFTGNRLFPMAAPTGGSTMIAAWLAVTVAALLELRDRAR